MGGDEIVAEWLGDMDAQLVYTAIPATRFSSTHYRCKNIIVVNNHTSAYCYIGKYYTNDNEFLQKAIIIWPKSILKFEYLDLYELGYRTYSTTHMYISLICMNHY